MSEALTGGLVHFICKNGMLEDETRQLIRDLLLNGPEAMRGIKLMLRDLSPDADPRKLQHDSSEIIARYRLSKEGQEGMKAFFEKRDPDWNERP